METLAEILGWVDRVGSFALLFIFARAVLQGKLIPEGVHNEVKEERNFYRAATLKGLDAAEEYRKSAIRIASEVLDQSSADSKGEPSRDSRNKGKK